MILPVALQTNTFIFLVNNVNKFTKVGEWPLVTLQMPLFPTHAEEYDINQRKSKNFFLISYLS